MNMADFDPGYLPATAPTGDGGIYILGVAPVDGTDVCRLADYHLPDASVLRMSREQAEHLHLALGHTLKMTAKKGG